MKIPPQDVRPDKCRIPDKQSLWCVTKYSIAEVANLAEDRLSPAVPDPKTSDSSEWER
jgi:hypothetical protein